MNQFLFRYHPVQPTTWVYLSSLVTIGLFFKFGRLWSMRNLDLLMLILLSPGLLLLYYGYQTQAPKVLVPHAETSGTLANDSTVTTLITDGAIAGNDANRVAADELPVPESEFTKRNGYLWLLGVGILWMIRLLIDPALVRRPMLAPNLTVGGLAFMGVALFVFLMANVISSDPSTPAESLGTGQRMDTLMRLRENEGPRYTILEGLPSSANKAIVIVAHTAILIGLVLVGYRHFGNAGNGFGTAMLYLLLPYTTQLTGRVDHFLPAAFLVWAVLCYRRPILSGLFVGLASGCIYYPLFLLPLWISFYWQKGWIRFVLGVVTSLGLMVGALLLTPTDAGVLSDLQHMFGLLEPARAGLEGAWDPLMGGWDPIYRMPVLAACFALCVSLALWPARKNLGTLISCSAAVMLSSQFWMGWSGGLYIAWFLPLVLLTIFRPNLEDRVAQATSLNSWLGKKRQFSIAA
jgi:hypothetical protein